MKRNFLMLVLFIGLGNLAFGQLPGVPEISFDKDEHDFGTVTKGGTAKCAFIVKNSGNQALIISKAEGSCDCTRPTWPKGPIMGGKSDTLWVEYDKKNVGPIQKTVTVYSNAENAKVYELRITGNVVNQSDQPPSKK